MQISVNLKDLEQLREYPDRELALVSKLEVAFKELLKTAELAQSDNILAIQKQLEFLGEERKALRERKKLIIEMYDILSGSTMDSREKTTDIVRGLNSLEKI